MVLFLIVSSQDRLSSQKLKEIGIPYLSRFPYKIDSTSSLVDLELIAG